MKNFIENILYLRINNSTPRSLRLEIKYYIFLQLTLKEPSENNKIQLLTHNLRQGIPT